MQAAAGQANVNVFLTGGAMRDMLAGFRIRDLDFVVEGNALKIAKAVCRSAPARPRPSVDENRKCAELLFPSGVTAQIAMSRQEKYARAGAKPQVSPATIQDDLRGRDFTCNAIALSLNRASRGLLLDPMNGLADIERKELRAVSTYGFYDDPSRLLRLVRFRVRLGFTVEERTQMQVANAREAEVEKQIPARALGDELKRISAEDNPGEILKGLEEAGLLVLFSPALPAQTERRRRSRNSRRPPTRARTMPAGAPPASERSCYALTEKLTPKEKQALIKATEMPKADVDQWQKIEARAKKLEAALQSAAHPQALARLPHGGRRRAGRRPVPAVPLAAEARAGAAAQLLPEVSAGGSGDHAGRVGDRRRQARHPEIRQGARRVHQRTSGPPAEEARSLLPPPPPGHGSGGRARGR